jgi:hypothetical protein
MPMERSYAAGSKLGEENGRALTGIASVNRYCKTFGSVRNGAKLGAGSSCHNWLVFSSLSVQAKRRADDARRSESYYKYGELWERIIGRLTRPANWQDFLIETQIYLKIGLRV